MRAVVVALAVLTSSSLAIADQAPGRIRPEVIDLEEPAPPVTRPKAKRYHRKLPPYSDRAILSDVWKRSWMLLEIDEAGAVTRLKVLRKPGYDLDDIAVREAFKLNFTPALDAQGHPMRVWIVWGFEWPANSWVVSHTGLATAMPPDVGFPPQPAYLFVPCEGSGPMRLGSLRYKGYRDCSLPDTSRHAELPWVLRPER